MKLPLAKLGLATLAALSATASMGCLTSYSSSAPWSFQIVTYEYQGALPAQIVSGIGIDGNVVGSTTGGPSQGTVITFSASTGAGGILRLADSIEVPAVWNLIETSGPCAFSVGGNYPAHFHDVVNFFCADSFGGSSNGGFAVTNIPSNYWDIQTPAPTPPSSGAAGTMTGGSTLNPGDSLYSPSGNVMMSYQGDGNLVVYNNGNPVWSSGTAGVGTPGYASMQGDGNFVVYDSLGSPVWSSGTAGSYGAYLGLSDAGGFALFQSGGTAIWWTATGAF
jgi:hypothetical protein